MTSTPVRKKPVHLTVEQILALEIMIEEYTEPREMWDAGVYRSDGSPLLTYQQLEELYNLLADQRIELNRSTQ